MARYAIGDIQGCFKSLECLLTKLAFKPEQDELWFAGDLVNRGPESLACLRYIKSLGASARVVLGNHDLHLLALHSAKKSPKRKDTLLPILTAPDCDELMFWLRQQPLMIWDSSHNFAMVHAGIPAMWSIPQAYKLSQEVSAILKSEEHAQFFELMYGNQPEKWSDELDGMSRFRVITNYFTRMRFIRADGTLDFTAKETLDSAPDGYIPWFKAPRADSTMILFGHWAALMGETHHKQFQALDTGCVWGGTLTAMNIDTLQRTSCACTKGGG